MDETQVSFFQQIIKEELIEEIPDRHETEVDPLALNNDQQEGIVTNEYNTKVKYVYIKDDAKLKEECVKKENESIYYSNEYNDLDEPKYSIDIKENIITCPEINNDVTTTGLFEDDVYNKDGNRKGEPLKRGSGKIITPEKCKKEISYAQYLKSQIRNIHSKSEYQCHECNKIFANHRNLKLHIEAVHLGIKNYKFLQCNKFFTQSSSLKSHIEIVHDRTKKYDCKQCHRKYSRLLHLDHHIIATHNGLIDHRRYECEICKKSFFQFQDVKKHINIVHQGLKQCECELCGKIFCDLESLRVHVNTTHERLEKFRCAECNKFFYYLAYLKKHIRAVHLRVKKYECPECNIKFLYYFQLKYHRKLHINHKNYETNKETKANECEICQKKFSISDQCKMHMFMMHGKTVNNLT